MTRSTLPETIRTGRLILRPFALTDVDDVLAYADDEEWSRYLRMLPRPYRREDAEIFLARQILLDPELHPAWAVELDGTVIGGVNVRFTFEHRRAEIGYSVARIHWNKGYCTEAARAVIDAAFEAHEDLNRVQARADLRNRASQRVMEKVGMTREGVFRMSRVERDEVMDEAWYAVIRPEWSAREGRQG